MESTPKVQCGRAPSIPRAYHDPPAKPGEGDGGIKRGGRTGKLQGQICPIGEDFPYILLEMLVHRIEARSDSKT